MLKAYWGEGDLYIHCGEKTKHNVLDVNLTGDNGQFTLFQMGPKRLPLLSFDL